jgi:ABC-type antimicrobial peptide transport system permease subunit
VPRFFLTLMTIFAGLAALLAAIGLYGVLSFAVGQRLQEIGVRRALGAGSGDVRSLVLCDGLRLAVVAVVVAGGLTLWTSRFLDGLLFETSARDGLTLALAVPVMLAVAGVACWVPARRAVRVDPVEILKAD